VEIDEILSVIELTQHIGVRLIAHVKYSICSRSLQKLLQTVANFCKLTKVCRRLQRLPCDNMLMLKQYDKKWAGIVC